MIKVYSTFQLDQAYRLVEQLINNGIEARVVDFSKRTPGSKIGLSVHEIPTVFIENKNHYKKAMQVISKFDPQFVQALKDSDIGKMPITKFLAILGVMLLISILGGLLWTWG